jgi:hypothetical protein
MNEPPNEQPTIFGREGEGHGEQLKEKGIKMEGKKMRNGP